MSVEQAIADIKAGKMVVLFDDEARENEGDLVMAAECVTPEAVNFMAMEARGLICMPMAPELVEKFQLPMMTYQNRSNRSTQFTVSVEAREGVSTGISAADRAHTIKYMMRSDAVATDIVSPGHVFPLRAKPKGVLERKGHTEGSVDLVKLAGFQSAAVICEISNPDGSMARMEQLKVFATKHQLSILTMQELITYRLTHETWVEKVAETTLPIVGLGEFAFSVYQDLITEQEIAVLSCSGEPLVRLHSACFTGDILASQRCDCGSQLHESLKLIHDKGGVLIYLPQEGRGIGLANKIKAYALQDQGMDTVEANLALGFKDDLRDYAAASQILRDLGLMSVKLITNNPRKIEGLTHYGVEVQARVPMEVPANAHNKNYLAAKVEKLGHLIGESV